MRLFEKKERLCKVISIGKLLPLLARGIELFNYSIELSNVYIRLYTILGVDL